MGSSGGGETKTITNNSPPQILNEGREGYEQSSQFYKGILQNPPVYEGERVAPFAPAQEESLKQQRDYFGQPQPYQLAAEDQIYNTASGNYGYNDPITPSLGNYGLDGSGFSGAGTLGGNAASPYSAQISGVNSRFNVDPRFNYKPMTDDEMKIAIGHMSEPILANLEENIMPQIRDSSQLAGQGATSTRSDVARQKAIEGYGRTVGSAVIAPLMQQREQLTQDFDKAMESYLQATAEGDANRAEQAQIEMARINAQSHDNANQINAQRDIAGGDLAIRAQEGASREKIAGAGLQSQDRNAYAQRGVQTWDAERNRQVQSAGMSGDMLKNEASRLNQLFQSGLIDQTQYQRMLDSAREQYEEPLYRQSQAAQALSGMSGLGPGSAESISKQPGQDNTMSTISTIAMIAGIAAKAMCSREFKDGVVQIHDRKELIDDILNLNIQRWHYKWEPETQNIGPILESCPEWLHDSLPKHLNLMNLVSGLVLTIQEQNKRIEALEKELKNVLPSS